jgi:SEL1 protein
MLIEITEDDSPEEIREKVRRAIGEDATAEMIEGTVKELVQALLQGGPGGATSTLAQTLADEGLVIDGSNNNPHAHDDDDDDDGLEGQDEGRAMLPAGTRPLGSPVAGRKDHLVPASDRPTAAPTTGSIDEELDLADDLLHTADRANVSLAVDHLERAAAMGSDKAVLTLAGLYDDGFGVERNFELAVRLYEKAASMGNPQAQSVYARLLATGVGVPRNEPLAILHYHFAAKGGDTFAQMALGFRHMYGLGVAKSCATALQYYSAAAQVVVDELHGTLPPLMVDKVRLADEENAALTSKNPPQDDEDVVNYYEYSAARGDVGAQVAMGQLHLYGGRGLQQDPARARGFFEDAAARGDAGAMAHLGMMYAHGDGVAASNATALEYYQKCADKGSDACYNGLGFLYLHGSGVDKDVDKALYYFRQSASKGNQEGQFNLGAVYVGGIGVKKDYAKALEYFMQAARQGHTLAVFNLGTMYSQGLGTPRSCRTAIQYLKAVAERGTWQKRLEDAHRMHRKGRSEEALGVFERLGELGYELAQSNAAFILEAAKAEGHQALYGGSDDELFRRTTRLYLRAAAQGSVAATVRLADAYYLGRGAIKPNPEGAAALYKQAAGLRSPEAMFTLGTMHHTGTGLPRDLHLAKRFYDLAAATSPEASVPAALALAVLKVQILCAEFDFRGYQWDHALILVLSLITFFLALVRHLRLQGFFA